MKVDSSNPRHWIYLILFGLNTLIAVAIRPLRRFRPEASGPRQIILYGHRLSGNLLALYRFITQNCRTEFDLTFLTMDPVYYQRLKREGVPSCKATSPAAITLMYNADAVISDHGNHSMLPLLWFSNLKFFDVWHGIPFKGFDKGDFRTQHRYTETWVASPLMAELYEGKFGFPPEKICVTGYARIDSLVIPQETDGQIRNRFGLDHTIGKKLVLFAPTWKQDSGNRTIFPFDSTPGNFLRSISEVCARHDAVPLLRTHLNAQLPDGLSNGDVELLPFGQFPDTESLLQITDVLICDWSSIAFDYLLLDRPTIFLDVPPPFAKEFSLGPEYRFDVIATSHDELLQSLDKSLDHESDRVANRSPNRQRVLHEIYGEFADGQSAERCIERLRSHLLSSESFR